MDNNYSYLLIDKATKNAGANICFGTNYEVEFLGAHKMRS